MKILTFTKDKSSLKYYLLAALSVAAVYSCKLMDLFIPLFDNIYYGNLVAVFLNISSMILWIAEFLIMFFVCKKLKIQIFSTEKKPQLKLSRLIVLFVLAILPMFIVSAYLNFTVKVVYDFGFKVTILGFWDNATRLIAWAARIVFMLLFIHFMHIAIEKNFKFNKAALNKYFPWGGIFSILIFGIIDFFFFSTNLAWFYLFLTFYYDIIYMLSDRKFLSTYFICYLIWLL